MARSCPSHAWPLAKAAREGDLDTVHRLLSAGADAEIRQQQFTPLHLAILYGHVEVAIELIAHGADVKALDPMKDDPLMLCCMSNGIEDEPAARVARVLLKRGVDARSPRGDPDEGATYTPLYMAKLRKKTKLAKVLRAFGATK